MTSADLEADRILKARLMKILPDAGWLSEETRDDPSRLGRERVWVVDPLDGTREFVRRLPEYTISVALVERGVPVLAVVHNPATGELFRAERGCGATLNGKPIRAERSGAGRVVLLASRSEIARGEWAPLEGRAEIRPVGSIAYKLALVAAGRADGTFSTGPKHEWDVAAGVLLVTEAGGRAVDRSGRAHTFNQPDPVVDGIVATAPAAADHVWALFARLDKNT